MSKESDSFYTMNFKTIKFKFKELSWDNIWYFVYRSVVISYEIFKKEITFPTFVSFL